MENKTEQELRGWRIIPHSYQIADTGDYDGHYELTNGKITIIIKDDPDEGVDAFKPLIEALNGFNNMYIEDYGAEYMRGSEDMRKQSLSELAEAKRENDSLIESMNLLTIEKNELQITIEQQDKEIAELQAQNEELRKTVKAQKNSLDADRRLLSERYTMDEIENAWKLTWENAKDFTHETFWFDLIRYQLIVNQHP